MNDLQKLGLTGLAFLIVAVPAGLVCLALWRLLPAGARRLLPLARRRPVRLRGADVWVAFLSMYVSAPLIYPVLKSTGFFALLYGQAANASDMTERKMLWVEGAARIFSIVAILLWFGVFRGMSLARLGVTPRRTGPNVAVGYLAWLVLTPPILLLYWLILQLPGIQPQPHPFERLGRLQLLDAEWALIIVLAVIAAPVLEELIFRGVLLSWQTSNPPAAQVAVGLFAVALSVLFGFNKEGAFHPGSLLFVLAMLPGYAVLPILARRWGRRTDVTAVDLDGAGPSERGTAAPLPPWLLRPLQWLTEPPQQEADRRVNVLLALYANGLLFAAFHTSAWPSPVPLMPLGIGLGWLAYRTRSLVAPVVTHSLFNGVATLYLFLG